MLKLSIFSVFCLAFGGTANCASLNTRQTQPCEQVIPCPRIYLPVCGDDGITYSNACELNSTTCGQVAVAYEGPCGSVPALKRQVTDCADVPMFCTMIYAPVCGTDGKTYGSQCVFNAQTCGTTIQVASQGECPGTSARQIADCANAPLICSAIYSPVCGSDGVTYSSQCMFSAQTCGTGIQIVSQGECKPAKKRQTTDCANVPQICTMQYDPVCGTDGVTYGNLCSFNARTCGTGITVAKAGEC